MKNYTEAERQAYRKGYQAGWEKGNRDRDKAKGCLKIRKERSKATDSHDLSKLEFVKIASWLPLEGDGYADGAIVYDVWECSNCGIEENGEDIPETHPYCRWCGARMVQE